MKAAKQFHKRKSKGGYDIYYGNLFRFTVPKIKGAPDILVKDEADYMVEQLNWAWHRGSVDWCRKSFKK